jgi:DUF1680 family protein
MFELRLRIPSWAAGAVVAVNGRKNAAPVMPGTFAGILREWRSGDRVELDLPLRQRLQAVDAEHPDTVALSAGPLALMRILDGDEAASPAMPRNVLLAAERRHGERRWIAGGTSGKMQLRAFADIDVQRYSLYQEIAG